LLGSLSARPPPEARAGYYGQEEVLLLTLALDRKLFSRTQGKFLSPHINLVQATFQMRTINSMKVSSSSSRLIQQLHGILWTNSKIIYHLIVWLITSLAVLNNGLRSSDAYRAHHIPCPGHGDLACHPDLTELLISLFNPLDNRLAVMAEYMRLLPDFVQNSFLGCHVPLFAPWQLSCVWRPRYTATRAQNPQNARLLFSLLACVRYIDHGQRLMRKLGDKLGSGHVYLSMVTLTGNP
jgi:hypothetical protein